MSDFIKRMIEQAEKEGRVHVIHVNAEEPHGIPEPPKVDEEAEAKEEAAQIAKMNRILYEAHLAEGFTKNEALALTRTVIISTMDI